MRDEEVAALAVICIFGLPTLSWVLVRMMQHRERIEMIRHGVIPPQEASWAHRHAAYPPQAPPWTGKDYGDAQMQLRKGIVTTSIGAALLIGLSFIGYDREGSFRLGPWLLGGLIPMFVGLAQILNAIVAGAVFPSMRSTMMPPPSPNAPPPPPQSGPYTYRPGATEELPRTKPPQAQ